MKFNRLLFYILSFTWGLPITLIGVIVALWFRLHGARPIKFHYCWYFQSNKINNRWGLSLGPFIFISGKYDENTLKHEHGHSIQNCWYGFLMPFIVMIPSIIRFWYIEIFYYRKKKKYKKAYDSIWFEGQATKLGTKLYNYILMRKVYE